MANQVPNFDVVEVVSVANNNDPAATGAEEDPEFIIGEPEIADIDIQGSVCYTHRYFKKIAGTEIAVCMTCQRFNAKRGAKDVKRKDTFSTAGGSTAGNFSKASAPFLYYFTVKVAVHTCSPSTRALYWKSFF